SSHGTDRLMRGIVWRERAELSRNFGGDLLCEWGRSCDEKASSILGVFGLREKIGSDPTRITALCEHDGFGGPGGKIDGAVGGDGGNEQSRDEGCVAAGNVAADGFDRHDALANSDTRFDFERPRAWKLLLGDAADIPCGVANRTQKVRADVAFGCTDFFLRK